MMEQESWQISSLIVSIKLEKVVINNQPEILEVYQRHLANCLLKKTD